MDDSKSGCESIGPELLTIIRDMVQEAVANQEAVDMIERFSSGKATCLTCLFYDGDRHSGICVYNPIQWVPSAATPQAGFPWTSDAAKRFCSKWVKKP